MIRKFGNCLIASCITILSVSIFSNHTQAQNSNQIEIGVLTCSVEGGVGFVFGSTKDLTCSFDPLGGPPNEIYVGEITKYGLDLGVTEKTAIVWAVLAPMADLLPGTLSGNYSGVATGASFGAGIGAKVLVGGLDQSISLQPLSVESKTGINIAVAVAQLRLTKVKFKPSLPRQAAYRVCGVQVIVAAGDTLSDIASRCGTTMDALLEANPSVNNIRELPQGKLVNVPKYPSKQSASRCGSHAVIGEGEGLFHVAKRCGTTMGALIDVNPAIETLSILQAGTVVNMPPYPTPVTRRRCHFNVTLGTPDSGWGTLDDIAEQCGVTVDALLENNPKIKNVREIPTGSNIKLPVYPAAVPARGCGSHAIVKRGESLFTIAKRCGTTAGAILDENPKLKDLKRLEPGRVINIPPFAIPPRA